MTRELQVTGDGSHTLHLQNTDVTYHSRYGAIQESEHVYIGAGLQPFIGQAEPIRILEVGFGTGLNAFLSFIEAKEQKVKIEYEAIEAFPLVAEEYAKLNYANVMRKRELNATLQLLHKSPWSKNLRFDSYFSITKHLVKLEDFSSNNRFHVIFFDAFAPNHQPELWTEEIFAGLYDLLYPGGVLSTYCSKGEVRRNLESAGFITEKLPGPIGKREILRASKTE